MADPIILPKLPTSCCYVEVWEDANAMLMPANQPYYTTDQLRARDIEVARLVLEAAAKVCRDFHATDSLSNYGLVMARMIDEVEVRHHE